MKNLNYTIQRIILLCTILITLVNSSIQAQDVYINEILASNSNVNTDDFGESDDWVELYNASSFDIDLGGMYLTDDLTNLAKYYIPPNEPSLTTIPANGFLLLWCDNQSIQGALHASFKLSSSGESVALVAADGTTIIDSYTFGPMTANVSMGRQTDGQTPWISFAGPSPEESNNGTISIADKPTATQVGGHYTNEFTVSLSTTSADATIHYTTNGSDPTDDDNEYTGPITIDETTVLRARTFASNMAESRVMTHTYLFNIDHEMPIFCLSTDDEHIWGDDDGIYENYLDRIEQPVHVELFEADGSFGFRQDMGIQIHGRHSQTYPHKGLSFRARNIYGNNKINYPLFPNQDYDEYGSFILRASGNDWKRMLCRDALASSLARDIVDVDSLIKDPDMDMQSFRPAIVYLNGEYFGIHNLREKMDYRYLDTHYGIDKDEADLVVNTSNADHGNTDAWDEYQEFIEGADFNNADDLAEIQANIELEHLYDYFIFNLYIDNNDWPGNNNRRWRLRQDGERWRYFVYDLDGSLGLNPLSDDYNSGDWTSPSIEMVMADTETYSHNEPYSTLLFRKLMENDSLRLVFFNRMADQLNILFTEQRTLDRIDQFEALYVAEIPQHADFWWDGDNDWAGDMDIARLFATHRNLEVFNQVHDYFSDDIDDVVDITMTAAPIAGGVIHLNSTHLFPEQFPWSGRHWAGIDIPMYTVPNPGYFFTGWTPASLGTESTTTMNLDGDETITANFQLGSTQIGNIVINEINYNSSPTCDAGDWVELHNAGTTAVDVSGWFLEDESRNYFNIPANTIIEAGGFLILAQNEFKFTTIHPQVTNFVGSFGVSSLTGDFGLSNGGEWIAINNADRSFRDTVRYGDSFPWAAAADGTGASLELYNPALDNALAQNWFAAAGEKGSPGAVNQGVLNLGNNINSCDGDTYTLDATYSFCNNCSYLWSNGATSPTISVTPISEGINSYAVTVTDAAGVIQSDEITITVSTPFSINTNSQSPCFGEINGQIDLQIDGPDTYSYDWSNGSTLSSINSLTPGIYSVTVSNDLACTQTETIELFEVPALALEETVTEILCYEGLGAVDLNISGGQGPYTYLWSNGAITEDISDLPEGNYNVVVSDANNCTISSSYSFALTTAPLEASISTEPSCFGNNQGSIAAVVSGGTGDYFYQWSDGTAGTDTMVNNLLPGSYQLTVTDENDCVWIGESVIAGSTTMTSTITATTLACFGDTNGSLSLTLTGGVAPYTYDWSNQQSGDSLQNLAGGMVAVTITDASSCEHYDSISVFEPAPISIDFDIDEINCTGETNGSLALLASGGTGALNHIWGNGSVANELNNLGPGNYNITVTDINNCSSIESVSLSDPAPIAVSIASSPVSCFDGEDGNIVLSPSGGTGEFTYQWSNGFTENQASNIPSGNYIITVTDTNNCLLMDTVFIDQPTSPITALIAVDSATCFGATDGKITLTAGGGTGLLSYNWDNGVTENINNNLTEGNYNVIITDANNCTFESTVYLPQPTPISLDIATDDVNCANGTDGSINVTASGGTGNLNYQWDNGGTNNTLTNLTEGTYNITVTDHNACEQTSAVTISEPSPISLTSDLTTVNCAGGSNGNISLVASGGTGMLNYLWSNGAIESAINNLTAGDYDVIITDENNCEYTEAFSVTEPSPISSDAEVSTINCHESADGSIIVTASGGTGNLNYQWSNGNSESSISNLAEGDYNLTISDANNCESFESFTLTAPAAITSSLEIETIDCAENTNGNIVLTAGGGTGSLSYEWSNGATGTTLSNLAEGLYVVTITDENNCIKIEEQLLTAPSAIDIDIDTSPVSCADGANGNITLNASGGTGTLSFNWSNGGTGNSISNLPEGNYEVTVTDENNCQLSETVYVAQAAPITLDTDMTAITCAEDADGSISVLASGGTGNLNYLWSDGTTGTELNNLAAGSYELTITDDNQCQLIETFNVATLLAIGFEYALEEVSCFGETDGVISLSAAGGTGTLSYQWSNGGSGAQQNNLAEGDYGFTITDENNCSEVGSVYLPEPSAIILDANINTVSCFGYSDGNIAVSASGGAGDFTYEWGDGTTETLLNNLTVGDYNITVTDIDGCSFEDTIYVAESAPILVDIAVDSISCFGASDANISVVASGGTGTLTYEWADGGTSPDLEDLGEGVYQLTLTDENDCAIFDSITLVEPAAISLESEVDSIKCFGDMDGQIALSPSGGTGLFDFEWSNGETGATINDLVAGDYEVTVTDANDCALQESFTLVEAAVLEVTFTSTNPTSNLTGDINVSPSGGTMPYEILWDNGATTFELTGLVAGDYTYTVTDANGCTFDGTVTLEFINGLGNPADYGLSIYPNPSKGIVYLKSDLAELNLVVYDLLGRPVRHYEQQDAGNLWTIDLGALTPGVYCFKIQSGEVEMMEMIVVE